MPACMPHPSPSHFRQVEARRRALGSWRGGEVEGVWHARQTVGNACGAVAIAHLVMNTLCRVGGPAAGSGEMARGDGGGETAREARDEGGELARAGVAAVQGAGSGAPRDGGEVGISRPDGASRLWPRDAGRQRTRAGPPASPRAAAGARRAGGAGADLRRSIERRPRLSLHLTRGGTCMARAWHVHGTCMVRAWYVHGTCMARSLYLLTTVDTYRGLNFPRSTLTTVHTYYGTHFTVAGDV